MFSNNLVKLASGLLLAGLACLAQAQVPMTGAGRGTPSAGGFTPGTPCAGTVVHLSDPNDLTVSASWTAASMTPTANDVTAPDGTLNAAGSLTSTAAGSYASFIESAPFTVTSGVTYSLSNYIKPVSGGTDINFGFNNLGGGDAISVIYDLVGGGTITSSTAAGLGTVTCSKITALASGWYYVSAAGSFSGTLTDMRALLFLPNATVGQSFDVWNFGL